MFKLRDYVTFTHKIGKLLGKNVTLATIEFEPKVIHVPFLFSVSSPLPVCTSSLPTTRSRWGGLGRSPPNRGSRANTRMTPPPVASATRPSLLMAAETCAPTARLSSVPGAGGGSFCVPITWVPPTLRKWPDCFPCFLHLHLHTFKQGQGEKSAGWMRERLIGH